MCKIKQKIKLIKNLNQLILFSVIEILEHHHGHGLYIYISMTIHYAIKL